MLAKNTSRGMFLFLLISIHAVSFKPCDALSLSSRQTSLLPQFPPRTVPIPVQLDHRGLTVFFGYRGGDSTPTSHGEDINDNDNHARQITQSAVIGLAPVKLVFSSLVTVGGVLLREIKSLTFHQKLFCLGTLLLGFFLGRLRPFWKRFTDLNDIPASLFGKQAKALRGRAVSVSDGDTIRFLHQPTIWHPANLRPGETKSEYALPIRLCTIDTPETAKFGKPGQPFGNEAKEYLQSLLQDKVVHVRLLQKDQYGRGVAEVFTTIPWLPFFRKKYMDAQMLKAGLAEVYLGGGAVYGSLGKEEYLEMEKKARDSKKGIWSQKKRESAAEYKKRTK